MFLLYDIQSLLSAEDRECIVKQCKVAGISREIIPM